MSGVEDLATAQETTGSAAATSPARAPRRYEALDSLRGVAACWIFFFHIPSEGHSWPLRIVQNGFLAVTFFFILSGFVIGVSYADRLKQGYPIGKFMLLRWGRIYPLHIFVIAIMLLFELSRVIWDLGGFREGPPFTGDKSIASLIWNVFLVQGVAPYRSWNRPSWSISVEMWTYLACAVSIHLMRARRLTFTAALLIIPGGILALAGSRLPFDVPNGVGQLLACCLGFGIGLFIYEMRSLGWHMPDNPRNRWPATIIELATIGFALFAAWAFGGKLSLLVYPAFALVVFVFSSQAGHISRVLLTAPMLLLGTLSYSIYMVQHLILDHVLAAIQKGFLGLPLVVTDEGRIVLMGNPWLCDAVTLVMLAMTIATAYLTYRYVEAPAREWSRRLAGRMGTSPKTPAR
jgi:peptidoglycan/LPS O-acetylase OafA/YrhL